jgi:hypothetical protein
VAAESGVMQLHMIFSQEFRSSSNFFDLGLKNNYRKKAMAMSFLYLNTTFLGTRSLSLLNSRCKILPLRGIFMGILVPSKHNRELLLVLYMWVEACARDCF